MAQIYADLIMKGAICSKTGKEWTLADVPSKIRAAVQKILDGEE